MLPDHREAAQTADASCCWRVTMRALLGFMAILALGYLFGLI